MLAWDLYSDEKNSRFSQGQEDAVKLLLRFYMRKCPRDGAFLSTFDIDKLEFYWNKAMQEGEGAIMGAWSFTHPNRIYIQDPRRPENPMVHEMSLRRIDKKYHPYVEDSYMMNNLLYQDCFITMIHELIHKFQFHTQPLVYLINCAFASPLTRIGINLGIEDDARKYSESLATRNFADEVENCYYTYQQMQLSPMFSYIDPNDESTRFNLFKDSWENGISCESGRRERYDDDLKEVIVKMFNAVFHIDQA